jgi:hypothetical protein
LVVQKALISLPLRYDANVSTIEETRDLTKMTMDELHGILVAYEMRTYIENGHQTEKQLLKPQKKQGTKKTR